MKYMEYVGGRCRKFAFIDRRGEVYGQLTVLAYGGRSSTNKLLWECSCTCGGEVSVAANNLVSGHTRSCGCLQKVCLQTHGLSRHYLYPVWYGMMARCYTKTNKRYEQYGGRGITVCKRWHSLSKFIKDMHPRPAGTSLDRIDNDAGYSPRNCRWGTSAEQANNKRSSVLLEFNGMEKTAAQWSRELGISSSTIRARLRLGWSVEDTLTYQTNSVRHYSA